MIKAYTTWKYIELEQYDHNFWNNLFLYLNTVIKELEYFFSTRLI